MMRKFISFIGIAILLLTGACNHSPLDIDEEPIFRTDEERWMYYLCSPARMGRRAGTIECDSVAVYLQRELVKMGYKVNEQPFRLKESMDLKNLYVVVEGVSDSIIVLGAHYDGAKSGENYPAADDNGSGVVALLSLCKFYSDVNNKPPKTLVAGFWAAEEVTFDKAFNGSKYFVKAFEDIKRVRYYCNLDCFARKNQGTYFYYSRGLERVGTIMDELFSNTDLTGLEFSIKENEKRNSDYMSFSSVKIPYFGWNDYDTSAFVHSTDDSYENISFRKISVVVDMTERLIDCL